MNVVSGAAFVALQSLEAPGEPLAWLSIALVLIGCLIFVVIALLKIALALSQLRRKK